MLDRACPKCLAFSLRIELRMRVHPDEQPLFPPDIGEPGRFQPVLYCTRTGCTFERWGTREDGHAVFIIPEDA